MSVETKICQRARGPHTENEFYCGRTLPMNFFSRGRAQCKDCNAQKTRYYNEIKATSSLDETDRLRKENLELRANIEKLQNENLKLKEDNTKYYNKALELHDENSKLQDENMRIVNEITTLEDEIRILERKK